MARAGDGSRRRRLAQATARAGDGSRRRRLAQEPARAGDGARRGPLAQETARAGDRTRRRNHGADDADGFSKRDWRDVRWSPGWNRIRGGAGTPWLACPPRGDPIGPGPLPIGLLPLIPRLAGADPA